MTPAHLAKLDKQLSAYLDYLTEGMVEKDEEIEAMRQRLQQCVTISSWSDYEIRKRLALRLEEILRPDAYVLDDTGFPKKGTHSVGVDRQYSGTLGRVDNCQVAPSLHVASDEGSGCIGMRLYLPEAWASDIKRRRDAGVPPRGGRVGCARTAAFVARTSQDAIAIAFSVHERDLSRPEDAP